MYYLLHIHVQLHFYFNLSTIIYNCDNCLVSMLFQLFLYYYIGPAVAPGNPSAPPANQSDPTSVILSWDPIPLDEQNGDLTYIVSIVALGLIDRGGRRKRQTNTFDQCLIAGGTPPAFNLTVTGNMTSVIVTRLSKFVQINTTISSLILSIHIFISLSINHQ